MARKRFRGEHCSIAQTLDRIGDWWTLLIIRDAFNGVTSFSDFQTGLGVAKNILSNRLSQLVVDGVFERVASRPGVDRYEYRLTEKGRDLLPVLIALMQWGDKWVYGPDAKPWDMIDARDRRQIRPVSLLSEDGRALGAEDVRMRPGPGADAEIRGKFEQMRAVAQRKRG